MSTITKKITFKGLEKKEQILFKSFLNLVKNDLDYDVELIQDPNAPFDGIDIVIMDADYLLTQDESKHTSVAILRVGSDADEGRENYVLRPVQWSDFKEGIAQLKFPESDELFEDQRVLPTEIALEIDEDATEEESQSESSSQSFEDASAYEFSLGQLSVENQHSFTSSEYVKVVEDVKGFAEEKSEVTAAVVLVSDDESTTSNSVLVIETNSLDRWEMSASEFDDMPSETLEEASELELPELSAKERKNAESKLAAGQRIEPESELWMQSQEIIAGARTLFFVQADERKVYSPREPAKWIKALRNKELKSVEIDAGWTPTEDLGVYPIERLIWVNALVGRTDKLDGDFNDNEEFMLAAWPHFELLELDNSLLKMATMLFVGPESAYTLMQKTGEGRAVVYGMLNACRELDLLVSPEQVEQNKYKAPTQEEGVFGKIKDVFR